MIAKIYKFLKNELKSIRTSIVNSYRSAPPTLQKGARRVLGTGVLLIAVYIAWGYGSVFLQERNLRAELQKGPKVKTATAIESPEERVVKLLGEAKPFAAVTMYARVSGYIKDVKVDKGDKVKKGQTLAIIESPEVDRAYQAVAADAKNKKAIAGRIEKLFAKDLVSEQERDTAKSEADVASAQLQAQEVLKSYQTLKAPFDGTVVARYSDPGALVQNATASQASSVPVLAISQVDQLRVYVYLDQKDATFVSTDTAAKVSLTENPDMVLDGHVARVSGQLDEKTRMLLAEIDLDNSKSTIIPGSLVEVSLNIKSPPGVTIPSDAIVLREGKTVVPIVDPTNHVTYSEVKIIDNDGKNAKVQSGVSVGQLVALNLGNSVADHGIVRPIFEDPKPTQSAAAAPASTKNLETEKASAIPASPDVEKSGEAEVETEKE